MMSKEAMKLALEALQEVYWSSRSAKHDQAITALREALAEPQEKYIYGTPLLDAMTGKAQQALDKMAKNARELGLDYEPVWDNLPSNKDVEDAMRLKRLSQLAEQPAQQEPVECQYGKGGYACCEGGPCKADEQNNAPQPAQQELVAWRDHVEQRLRTWRQSFVNRSGDQLALDDFMDKQSLDDLIDFVCDEYTSPPAQRTWVGLTDCEREKLRSEADEADAGYRKLIKATEAKLREKNV